MLPCVTLHPVGRFCENGAEAVVVFAGCPAPVPEFTAVMKRRAESSLRDFPGNESGSQDIGAFP